MLSPNKLKSLINKSGLNQKEFCERSGISEAGFYTSLRRKGFRMKTLERFATVLNVPVSAFFGHKEDLPGNADMGFRYHELMIKLKVKQKDFCKVTGITEKNLQRIIDGTELPNVEIVTLIAEHYPTINITWLLTGKGSIINEISNYKEQIKQLEADKLNMQHLINRLSDDTESTQIHKRKKAS